MSSYMLLCCPWDPKITLHVLFLSSWNIKPSFTLAKDEGYTRMATASHHSRTLPRGCQPQNSPVTLTRNTCTVTLALQSPFYPRAAGCRPHPSPGSPSLSAAGPGTHCAAGRGRAGAAPAPGRCSPSGAGGTGAGTRPSRRPRRGR